MSERKKFTVSREKWIRGTGVKSSQLARLLRPSDGHMCCLGFVCLQHGLTEHDISDVSEPGDLARAELVEGLLTRIDRGDADDPDPYASVFNSELTSLAMDINDESSIDDDTREAQLAALFAKHGYEMEFVP